MRSFFTATIALLLLASPVPAQPQQQQQNVGGIQIDAEGVVRPAPVVRASRAAKREMAAFAEENLDPTLVLDTPGRGISLRRLEQAVAEALNQGSELSPSLAYLGGLYRIDEIHIDEANKDVILFGPAGGFGPGPDGRMICSESGRPPLQLDDLVTALRAVRTNGSIGVSIDPSNDNLRQLQDYLRRNSSPATVSQVTRRYQQMAKILGMQEIRFWGVPADSHFAIVLLEADYMMKRIAMGQQPSGVRGVVSHLSLLAPMGNSLQRWWFTPYYDPIETDAGRSVYRLSGQRAQVLAQEEFSDAQGRRQDAATTRLSTERFAQQFTEHFPDLADHSPTFAELQNVFDLAVFAALLDRERIGQRLGWDLPVLRSDERLPLRQYAVPKGVPSHATTRRAGRGTMLGLIGGVTLDVGPVVDRIEAVPGLELAPPNLHWIPEQWWGNVIQRDGAGEER